MPVGDRDEGALERRLDELESRYTLQQQMLEEMSSVLYEQQRTIDVLSSEVRALREKLQGVTPGLVEGGEEGPPPHY